MKKILFLLLAYSFNLTVSGQCWQEISNGQYHTLAIREDGTLWAWGFNQYGQLGTGDFTDQDSPVQIGTETDWKAVSAGAIHSLALKQDGTLWSWGNNDYGQLGQGTNETVNVPLQMGSENTWNKIFAGIWVSSAIKNDGTLWGWGSNSGQLAQLTSETYFSSPIQIGTDNNWKAVCFGGAFVFGLKTDGTLWSWGNGVYGELGNGQLTSTNYFPTQIGNANDWQEISAGFWYGMAIKNNGTLWRWGQGYGSSPTVYGVSNNWSKINCYFNFNLAIKNDGTLWSWGDNSNGQLGNGTTTNVNNPTQISDQVNWTKITNGYKFSTVLNSVGEIKSFGQNNYGQLGIGSNTDVSIPSDVSCASLANPGLQNGQFEIFPNPVRDRLEIRKSSGVKIYRIRIIDMTGKTTLKEEGDATTISVASLPSGVYLLTIESTTGIYRERIVKE